MINVFIVHAGDDENYITENIEPFLCPYSKTDENIQPKRNSIQLLYLKSKDKVSEDSKINDRISALTGNFWRFSALRKIKQAQVVLVLVSKNANKQNKKSSLGWEVEQARRLNKLIIYHSIGGAGIPEYLFIKDTFTKKKKEPDKIMNLSDIKKRLENFDKGYYEIFTPGYMELEENERLKQMGIIMDQYKMFQKTSEDLVVRRQNLNSFYLTVNSALIALVGTFLGLISYPLNLYVIFFMCIVGLILDVSWIGVLNAYGTLNSAKMKLINLIEEQLPVALYDMEWQIMSDKLNSRKYISFTDSEKRIPKLFMITYLTILVVIIILGIKVFLIS